ncbi:signal peptidase I [Marmoricola sp. RAF53]|uniref:signal peptidase I n=1 Tax=Marmoricola sp. RAF53 TaxID=3233059 RepID=UPI003F9C1619
MSTQTDLGTDRAARVRRGIRWTVNAVIVLLILGCVAWIVPALFGFSRYVITGGSMTGTYDKGSVVFEKPVAVEDLKVGDVITYLPPADSGVPTLVTHRVVKMEPAAGGGTLFTTKGDANPKQDPWHFRLVDTEQPVVQFAVPRAGWIFIALADREVRMLVIGLPAALIALGALGQLVAAMRERRRGEKAVSVATEALPTYVIPSQRNPSSVGTDQLV